MKNESRISIATFTRKTLSILLFLSFLFPLPSTLFPVTLSPSSLSAQTTTHPLFAPYVDCSLWPPYDISKTDSTGICYYTLAFIVDDPFQPGANPCWGGFSTYDTSYYQTQIAGLRSAGGEVIISFGGANGVELAYVATSPQEAYEAYQLIVDAYQLNSVDCDIEGMMVADSASIERRSAALKMLQDANPGLEISLTLPVMPFGLTPDGIKVVESAVNHGVDLGVVNIMTMDYGPTGDMGDWAIEAANNLFLQLKEIYILAGISLPDSLIWKKVGITPMIGENDVQGEIFYLDDADDVRDFALLNSIGRVSMWSANRDQACVNPGDPLYICSHIPQLPFEFSQTFMEGGVMNYCQLSPVPVWQKDSEPGSIYPNPASFQVTVSPVNPDGLPVPFSIYDLTGRVVNQGLTVGSIDLHTLHQGIYIVEWLVDGVKFVQRVVVIR
ncbi:T9SS type A sorting domain-containing protein [Bacteroidota bacterium]